MTTYSLSLYRITINKINKPDELETLDCFDGGKSMVDIIDDMFTRWHSKLYNHQWTSAYPQRPTPRVSRIKQGYDGQFIHYRTGGYISGIIESGAYGTEQSIIDQQSGLECYRKGKNDAPMVPFYFCFYFPRNCKYGYLILERIGNDGIFTMLSDAIRWDTGTNIFGKYTLKIKPYILDSILDKNVNSFFRPRKIFLRGVRSSVFRAGIPMENSGGVGHIEADVVLSVRETNSSPMRDLLRGLMESSRNNQPLSVDGVECVDVAFQGKIGNRKRTVSVAKLENLGTNLDVTNEVAIDDDGYPTYESLHKEASHLITEIKHETE